MTLIIIVKSSADYWSEIQGIVHENYINLQNKKKEQNKVTTL